MDSGTWYASATASDDGTKNPSDATSWHVSTSSGWVEQSGVSAICATPSPTPIGGFPDLLALNTLYESTDGPNWVTNTFWLSSDATACDPAWHGLSCGSFEGETRVSEMVLNNNVLSGSLPTQFGRLDAAENILLHENSITGTIPTEFGNLKEGAILWLHENSITGTLPTEIGDLGLTTFSVFQNSMNGSLPTQLGNMGMLTSLNMYENFVDGQIPTEVGRLPIVDRFVGSYQRFTGQIPTQIGMWTAMTKSFAVGTSSLSGTLPTQIGRMTSFQSQWYGDACQPGVRGTLPTQIGLMMSFTTAFYMNQNRLSGTVPTQIGMITQMTEFLRLNSNSFHGPLPTQLGQLTDFENWMDFSNNEKICGDMPTQLSALYDLKMRAETIHIDGTRIGTPCDLCDVGHAFSLDANGATVCTLCPAGYYQPGNDHMLGSCTACPVGKSTGGLEGRESCAVCGAGTYAAENGTGTCTDCAAGTSLSDSGTHEIFHDTASDCSSCTTGTFSSAGSSSCTDCESGTYTDTAQTACNDCPAGFFSPPRSASCTECEVGKFTSAAASPACDKCLTEWGAAYTSDAGASSCTVCAEGYYKDWRGTYTSNDDVPPGNAHECVACPTKDGLGKDWLDVGVTLATCKGGDMMPVPAGPQGTEAPWGFWVDRSDIRLAGFIYPCLAEGRCGINPSQVRKFDETEDACWSVINQTLEAGGWTDTAACDPDEVQCEGGSQGLLCGSCADDQTFSETSIKCVDCGGNDSVLPLVCGLVLLVLVLLMMMKRGQQCLFRCMPVLKGVDQGQLKVVWSTLQIVASVSWSLDIPFPEPFASLLNIFAVTQLNFFKVRCYGSRAGLGVGGWVGLGVGVGGWVRFRVRVVNSLSSGA